MMPRRYSPMLATLVDAPFDDPAWVYETKFDGFRMIADITRGPKGASKVTLYSRNGIDVTKVYPAVSKALGAVKGSAVLDGELCALDARGVSRFQLLQNARNTKARLRYYLFDALFVGGKDMRKLPLLERKAALKALIPNNKLLQYSEHRPRWGKKYFKEAQKKKWEGLIAKRAAGNYYSGKRTREWLKIKTGYEQEAVIVGFTAPRKSRNYFGSLVLAVRLPAGKAGDHDAWRYVGHVGTGFSEAALKDIHAKLLPLKVQSKPFAEKIKWEDATTWVRPKLVGEIKFSEWTRGGEMRHPVFLGLRSDKKATDVILETSSNYK